MSGIAEKVVDLEDRLGKADEAQRVVRTMATYAHLAHLEAEPGERDEPEVLWAKLVRARAALETLRESLRAVEGKLAEAVQR